MTKVATMGADCGRGDAGELCGGICAVERAVFNTPSVPAAGASVESGA
jgi:hypothetical protein